MPTTSISDAVVFPQDPGTSPADSIGFATDPPSGGSFALHAAYQSGAGAYVLNGNNGSLGFTVDATNNDLTVDAGVAYILQDASNVDVQSSTGQTYDVNLPSTVSIVYAVIVPTSVTVGLDTDVENTVYLSVDPDTRNSATVHAGNSLSAPTNPSIKLGTVDSGTGSVVSRANDRPGADFDDLAAQSADVGTFEFDDANESPITYSSASGTTTLDISAGNWHEISATGDVTVAFSNVSTEGNSVLVYIEDGDGSGPHTISWPASVVWSDGTVEDTVESGGDLEISLVTPDGGTTWRARLSGKAFA